MQSESTLSLTCRWGSISSAQPSINHWRLPAKQHSFPLAEVVFPVPVLFLLSSLFGVGGIWATVPVSEFLTLLLSVLLLKRLFASRLSDND